LPLLAAPVVRAALFVGSLLESPLRVAEGVRA